MSSRLNILTVLLEQGYTLDDARELIQEAKDEMNRRIENGNMEDAFYICEEYFGLEPDYITDLMGA